jgi:DNA-binding transcriptional MerR regulator
MMPSEPAYLTAILDTIFTTEQEPIRRRDALMKQYGVDSPEAEAAQQEFRRNHAVNIKKIRQLLDMYHLGDQGATQLAKTYEIAQKRLADMIRQRDELTEAIADLTNQLNWGEKMLASYEEQETMPRAAAG